MIEVESVFTGKEKGMWLEETLRLPYFLFQ